MIEKCFELAEKCKQKHMEIVNADWKLLLIKSHKMTFWDLNEKEKLYVFANLKHYKEIGSKFIQKYSETRGNHFFHAALNAFWAAATTFIKASKLTDDES